MRKALLTILVFLGSSGLICSCEGEKHQKGAVKYEVSMQELHPAAKIETRQSLVICGKLVKDTLKLNTSSKDGIVVDTLCHVC